LPGTRPGGQPEAHRKMTEHHRPVRSFVRRAGRLTRAQERALAELLPRWGIEPPPPDERLDLAAVFGRSAPRVLEIGFGDGASLAQTAAANPGNDYLGIEVHEPGVGHLLLEIERLDLANVRVVVHDAVEVLNGWIEPASIDRLQLFFPDPWPKKRHHKRRIVQPGFLGTLARVLKPGGVLHMATDWEPYALHMRETAGASPFFDEPTGGPETGGRPPERPETKFERRGLRLGHRVADLLYLRNDEPVSSATPP